MLYRSASIAVALEGSRAWIVASSRVGSVHAEARSIGAYQIVCFVFVFLVVIAELQSLVSNASIAVISHLNKNIN